MTEVFFEPPAEADLDEIYQHIAKDNPPAAKRFISELRERVTLLGNYPDLGRERPDIYPGTRRFSFGQCAVYYRHQEDRVVILHVVRAGRDLSSLF